MQPANTNRGFSFVCLFFLCVVLVQACAKNTLTSTWADESFSGPVKGPVLVIGVFRDAMAQKIYEDSFAEHLSREGVTAVPSYKYGMGATEPDKEKLQKVIMKSGATAVLITHLSVESTSTLDVAPIVDREVMVSSWDRIHGYHSSVYKRNLETGYTVDKEIDQVEARLFVSSTGKRIWSARSKSVNLHQYLRKDDDRLEEIFIQNMKHYKLL